MLKSRYKALQLILTVIFCILFISIPFIVFNNDDSGPKVALKFLSLLSPLPGIFLLYSIFQKSPRVVFDPEFIEAKYLTGSKTGPAAIV